MRKRSTVCMVRHMRLSVVIPAYCQAHRIAQAVRAACAVADEVVVVDGCSPDGTAAQAAAAGARVVMTRCRGADRLQAGARRASGDVVMFVRPDVLLPADARAVVQAALADPAVDWGRVEVPRAPMGRWRRLLSWAHSVRLRWRDSLPAPTPMFFRRSWYLAFGAVVVRPRLRPQTVTHWLRAALPAS
jgi:glycosyltransferase involved in cell wall biosynthesis